jgi:hypothetical protein
MDSLDSLAVKYGTDKSSAHHNYTRIYEELLSSRRDEMRGLLEIGVGGVSYKGAAGASLMVWRDWLPRAEIVGIDNDKSVDLDFGPRISIIVGDQTSRGVLEQALAKFDSGVDLVIDDGSHVTRLTIATFEFLWPQLNAGGIYVIEDTQCTYTQPVFQNNRQEFDQFLLRMIHCVDFNGRKLAERDAADFGKRGDFVLNEYESSLKAIEIHRGLVILRKRGAAGE